MDRVSLLHKRCDGASGKRRRDLALDAGGRWRDPSPRETVRRPGNHQFPILGARQPQTGIRQLAVGLSLSCSLTQSFWSGLFFLSPRRRSGERTEERGIPIPTSLLSPALSSIRWRRGSFFSCGWAALRSLRDERASSPNREHDKPHISDDQRRLAVQSLNNYD